MEFNKIFRTVDNTVFTKIAAKDVENFKGNYITVINNKPVAVVDGQEVSFPQVLINEIGVEYRFVDFYQHGKEMAKKHGVFYAQKQENVRVWPNIKPGEILKTVIDGFEEHRVELKEGFVAIQNTVKNEFYSISAEELEARYEFVRHEFDYELYKPKAGVVSEWAYSDINVFGVLWGGLEFLTTPMINITNPNDCYGCNYTVWWGNDGRLASYKVVRFVRGCKTVFYEGNSAQPTDMAKATFQPPKALED